MAGEYSLKSEDYARLNGMLDKIKKEMKTLVGYPGNNEFDYSYLFPFLDYTLNNVGYPFASSNYRVNTLELEQEVLYTCRS